VHHAGQIEHGSAYVRRQLFLQWAARSGQGQCHRYATVGNVDGADHAQVYQILSQLWVDHLAQGIDDFLIGDTHDLLLA
jgi:hypothetical protein